jgi:dienelactone hydrolase
MDQVAASPFDPAELKFVLSPETSGVEVVSRASYDLYERPRDTPLPLVVFVHGPVVGTVARPREWPVYRGYAALAANAGLAGAIADLDYTDVHALESPTSQLEDVLAAARSEETVDNQRVAVWAFSGGARLVGRLIEDPPDWIKVVALTYPVAPAVADVRLPVVLTRVGQEDSTIQAKVDELLTVAPAAEVIRLDEGQHGFDMLDHNDESRQAVTTARDAVVRLLT